MFPYTVKYTESDSDIQNNNRLYKIHPTSKILSTRWKRLENVEHIQTFQNVILLYV